MSKIVRDGWVVELDGAPQFEYGQKVRSKSMIRNDGTFPGKDIGEVSRQERRGGICHLNRNLSSAILYLRCRVSRKRDPCGHEAKRT